MIIWKCLPLLFCYFTIFSEAVSQRNSRSSFSDVFFKKIEHLLRRTYLGDCFWNSWNRSLFSVRSALLLPTFLAGIFQVLFTYYVIAVFATHFDFGRLFLFSLYFSSYFFKWHRFLSLASCILTSAAFGDSTTFKTLCIFVTTVCSNPTELAKRRVICTFKRSIPNCQMKSKVRMSYLISLKTLCAFFLAMSSM